MPKTYTIRYLEPYTRPDGTLATREVTSHHTAYDRISIDQNLAYLESVQIIAPDGTVHGIEIDKIVHHDGTTQTPADHRANPKPIVV